MHRGADSGRVRRWPELQTSRPSTRRPVSAARRINVSTNSLADLPWWSVFKDPVLQDLVRTALTNSYDLRIILTRVDQARALQAQTRSQFLPQVDYRGDATRGKNSFLGSPAPNGGKTIGQFPRPALKPFGKLICGAASAG